jgi:invasin-like protein
MNGRGICLLPCSLVLLPLLLLIACDKATPVAPNGTILTIGANPSRIGLNGSSVITVVGRKPDGNPLNPGTEIRFSTDRGTIDPIATIQNGTATAVLRGDGRSGTAKVTASTGNGDTSATTDVQIGESAETKPTLLVSANPNDVPVNGTSTITVIARNADGSPVSAGQTIVLTSTLGTLNPTRPTTRADGTATSTLQAGSLAGTATITAVLGASDAATTMVSIRDAATGIALTADPSTVQRAQGGTVTLSALVINGQGLALSNAPVTFTTETGRLSATVVNTGSDGVAEATLTLTAGDLAGAGGSVTVTVATPSGNGQFIRDTFEIAIQ